MNEIFIIINDQYHFVLLDFTNNTLLWKGTYYTFYLIEKHYLKINNNDLEYTLFTEDSYIYSNLKENLIHYSVIELVHNEWNDQALLLKNEKKLFRIRDRDQFGYYTMDEQLIIDWNYWGKEKFIQLNEDIYIQESLKIMDLKTISNNNVIFIHCCNINNGFDILIDQLRTIKKTGLLHITEKCFIYVLGEKLSDHELLLDDKIEINYLRVPNDYFELKTINKIKEYVDTLDKRVNILYIHSKGVRNAGNSEVTRSWRKMMEYFLIERYEDCIKALNTEEIDTVGNNLINTFHQEKNKMVIMNENHCYHYSGNFWWASSDYIQKLDSIIIQEKDRDIQRYQAENWLLSKMIEDRTGIFFQDNTNVHPYHRWVFFQDNNKKKFIKIKKIKLE